ncbi:glutaredoxin family protein [Halomonas korlensis]|uniref:Glutaredoxin-like domain n=1 Tax=Halomonas korlensis TaxID=463301 RepID=A0A1I7FUW4_9GAMM|nr:glutaredoxin family protein [Halomonas korlensis]SFU40012.1 Glutaredoxin-like domain [Halomonas korlensis]
MIRLRLYTTLGCHLCEQLEALLETLAIEEVELERVEISADDALIERYGVRIPVLADNAGEELDRGFEAERLAAWLAERGWLGEASWSRFQRDAEPYASAPRGAVMRGGRRYLGG